MNFPLFLLTEMVLNSSKNPGIRLNSPRKKELNLSHQATQVTNAQIESRRILQDCRTSGCNVTLTSPNEIKQICFCWNLTLKESCRLWVTNLRPPEMLFWTIFFKMEWTKALYEEASDQGSRSCLSILWQKNSCKPYLEFNNGYIARDRVDKNIDSMQTPLL